MTRRKYCARMFFSLPRSASFQSRSVCWFTCLITFRGSDNIAQYDSPNNKVLFFDQIYTILCVN